jgi:hypothetical protein
MNFFTHLKTCTCDTALLEQFVSFGSFFVEFCAKFDRPTLFESIRHRAS